MNNKDIKKYVDSLLDKKLKSINSKYKPPKRSSNKSKIDSNISNHRHGIKSKMYSIYERKEIRFDSNWERFFFIRMSKNRYVRTITRNVRSIRYFNSEKGKICRYIPDFIVEYITGARILIEIKPKNQVNETNVQEKKIAAEDWCRVNGLSYMIVTEDELKIIGAL